MSEQEKTSFAPADMIGEIILSSREIESLLHAACPAEVAGIHALTEMLAGRLPEDLKRQLHYIATIRNRAAHESEFMLSSEEFASFRKASASALATLKALFPPQPQVSATEETASSGGKTFSPEVEVEKELWDEWLRKIAMLGYFPVAGVVYLLFLLLGAIFARCWVILLGVLYVCSAIITWRGVISEVDRGLLYVGGAGVLIAYITVLVIACKSPVKGFPGFAGWLPGLNVLYLPMRWLRDLAWKKFLLALTGVAFFAAAVYAVCGGFYSWALGGVAGTWILSVCGSIIWGRKNEK